MAQNQNETELYSEILEKLCTFLKNAGIKKIVFYQFDFLMIYFPVYLIVKDLKEKLKEEPNAVDFKIIESDEKILNELKTIESFNHKEGTLNLGLCEPVLFNIINHEKDGRANKKLKEELQSEKYMKKVEFDQYKIQRPYNCRSKEGENGSKDSYFMHLPFINFPPLYGVALKNNPKINKIKRTTQSKERNNKVSIVDYWKHFSAKLSLLEKGSFKALSASLYPKGSTTDWFIRTKDQFEFRKKTWIKDLETEFDDLFHGQVDVAFTIQPWDSVVRSETKAEPVDIDVVYKNVCREYDSTSLIFHTSEKVHLIFGDYILNCFNELLKEKIKVLYETEAAALDDMIRDYCLMLANYCKVEKHKGETVCDCHCHALPDKSDLICNNKTRSKDKKQMEAGCLFENKMALRLTNDSQIYKHLKVIERDGLKPEKAVANYFVEKFGNTPEGHNKFQKLMQVENKS